MQHIKMNDKMNDIWAELQQFIVPWAIDKVTIK